MGIVSPPEQRLHRSTINLQRLTTLLHHAVCSMRMLVDLGQGANFGQYGREPHDALSGPLGRHVRDYTPMDGQRTEELRKCLSTV